MNEKTQLAWQIIETTGTSLFLTGKAGTGKTTFLRRLKEQSSKNVVVVAPTGIAAINAGGVTIHSFFQLSTAPHVPGMSVDKQSGQYRFSKNKVRLIRAIDVLVIDEISMVRADVLDAVDEVLRRFRRNSMPFGGVQLVMIGDLGQLAPVATDEEWQLISRYYDTAYFFSSMALRRTSYSVVEFTHVYRQNDTAFLDLLNKVRDNKVDDAALDMLNSRYIPSFVPNPKDGYIRLTTHNNLAQRVNEAELDKLPGRSFSYTARVEGKYPEYMFPTDEELKLKKGAQVMFVKNDSSAEKRYYNGMIGTVCDIDDRGFSVRPKGSDDTIDVTPEQWENCRYVVDEKTGEIREEVDGIFVQFPIKTAWAITIHKSQGLTFEHAIIDASMSFAHGQTYVALSRCKSLEGMVLSRPLGRKAFIRDGAVDNYVAAASDRLPSATDLSDMQRRYCLTVIADLFDFTSVTSLFYTMMRIMTEHFQRTYPKLTLEYKARNELLTRNVTDVAGKFHHQYERLILTVDDYAGDLLQERLAKAAAYFLRELTDVDIFLEKGGVKTENNALRQRIDETMTSLKESLDLKLKLLVYISMHGFEVNAFLRHKSILVSGGDEKPAGRTRTRTRQTSTVKQSASAVKSSVSAKTDKNTPMDAIDANALCRKVFDKLTAWRRQLAQDNNIPSYCIMRQNSLEAIAATLPDTPEQLAAVPYIGNLRAKKYGSDILDIIRTCRKEYS